MAKMFAIVVSYLMISLPSSAAMGMANVPEILEGIDKQDMLPDMEYAPFYDLILNEDNLFLGLVMLLYPEFVFQEYDVTQDLAPIQESIITDFSYTYDTCVGGQPDGRCQDNIAHLCDPGPDGILGTEDDHCESWENCCYEAASSCLCPGETYCDLVDPNPPPFGIWECKDNPSEIQITVIEPSDLTFGFYNPAGNLIHFNYTIPGFPAQESADLVGENCDAVCEWGDDETCNALCIYQGCEEEREIDGNYRGVDCVLNITNIAPHDHDFEYKVTPTFSGIVDLYPPPQRKSFSLSTTVGEVSIGSSQCGDGEVNELIGETPNTCCYDTLCPAEYYCNGAPDDFPENWCNNTAEIGLNYLGIVSPAGLNLEQPQDLCNEGEEEQNDLEFTVMYGIENPAREVYLMEVTGDLQNALGTYAVDCEAMNDINTTYECDIRIEGSEEYCSDTLLPNITGHVNLGIEVNHKTRLDPEGRMEIPTLTAELPNVSIHTYTPDDGVCDSDLGEVDCPDCECPVNYYCYGEYCQDADDIAIRITEQLTPDHYNTHNPEIGSIFDFTFYVNNFPIIDPSSIMWGQLHNNEDGGKGPPCQIVNCKELDPEQEITDNPIRYCDASCEFLQCGTELGNEGLNCNINIKIQGYDNTYRYAVWPDFQAGIEFPDLQTEEPLENIIQHQLPRVEFDPVTFGEGGSCGDGVVQEGREAEPNDCCYDYVKDPNKEACQGISVDMYCNTANGPEGPVFPDAEDPTGDRCFYLTGTHGIKISFDTDPVGAERGRDYPVIELDREEDLDFEITVEVKNAPRREDSVDPSDLKCLVEDAEGNPYECESLGIELKNCELLPKRWSDNTLDAYLVRSFTCEVAFPYVMDCLHSPFYDETETSFIFYNMNLALPIQYYDGHLDNGVNGEKILKERSLNKIIIIPYEECPRPDLDITYLGGKRTGGENIVVCTGDETSCTPELIEIYLEIKNPPAEFSVVTGDPFSSFIDGVVLKETDCHAVNEDDTIYKCILQLTEDQGKNFDDSRLEGDVTEEDVFTYEIHSCYQPLRGVEDEPGEEEDDDGFGEHEEESDEEGEENEEDENDGVYEGVSIHMDEIEGCPEGEGDEVILEEVISLGYAAANHIPGTTALISCVNEDTEDQETTLGECSEYYTEGDWSDDVETVYVFRDDKEDVLYNCINSVDDQLLTIYPEECFDNNYDILDPPMGFISNTEYFYDDGDPETDDVPKTQPLYRCYNDNGDHLVTLDRDNECPDNGRGGCQEFCVDNSPREAGRIGYVYIEPIVPQSLPLYRCDGSPDRQVVTNIEDCGVGDDQEDVLLLGYIREGHPNQVPIFHCVNRNVDDQGLDDHRTLRYLSECQEHGYEVVGDVGSVYADVGEVRSVVEDREVRVVFNIEYNSQWGGEEPTEVNTLYRCYNRDNNDHADAIGSCPDGYQEETILGYTLQENPGDLINLYKCTNSVGLHLTTNDVTCDDYEDDPGLQRTDLGFISVNPEERSLLSCINEGGNQFPTMLSSCTGDFVIDEFLGYIKGSAEEPFTTELIRCINRDGSDYVLISGDEDCDRRFSMIHDQNLGHIYKNEEDNTKPLYRCDDTDDVTTTECAGPFEILGYVIVPPPELKSIFACKKGSDYMTSNDVEYCAEQGYEIIGLKPLGNVYRNPTQVGGVRTLPINAIEHFDYMLQSEADTTPADPEPPGRDLPEDIEPVEDELDMFKANLLAWAAIACIISIFVFPAFCLIIALVVLIVMTLVKEGQVGAIDDFVGLLLDDHKGDATSQREKYSEYVAKAIETALKIRLNAPREGDPVKSGIKFITR